MKSGTLSDKISALTLAIQESPLHNGKALEALFGIASKRGRSQAIGALGALVDLLGPGLLLPPDRRLRHFHSQPGLQGALAASGMTNWVDGNKLPSGITKAHIIYWAFEDWLKEVYFKVIQVLEVWCNDEVEHSRMRGLELVFTLLKEKPEQEANLLRLLVHKLSDRERKVSSRASYLTLQLQTSHPAMKGVIVRAVEQEVLRRPGRSIKTQYCAINTLNQTILTAKDPDTTNSLLRIYFDMFADLLRDGQVHKLADMDNFARKSGQSNRTAMPDLLKTADDDESTDKLVASILTGINRAAPFAQSHNSM